MNAQNSVEVSRAPRRVEDRLPIALLAGRMVTWEWDPLSDAINASHPVGELFGVSDADGFPPSERGFFLVHPEDREGHGARVRAAVAGNDSWHGEYRVIRPGDGAVLWIEERAHAVINPRTGVVVFVGVAWDITERKAAEVALRESEEKYRALFSSIDEAFCVQEVLFDAADRPVDLRYLEVNRAFESITGLHGVVGRTARELLLDVQASWLRVQADVALTGEPVRFENYVAAWDRWLDIYSLRIGKPGERRVASVFSDITERRRSEIDLRHAARFAAFRVALHDALRTRHDPDDIQSAALGLLGADLDASRALYAEVDHASDGEWLEVRAQYCADGVAPDAVRTQLFGSGGTLPDELRAGAIVVVPSVEDERRFTRQERRTYMERGIRAFVDVPLMRRGRLAAILSVQDELPRAWSPQDVARAEETAQRTWASVDRARAEAARRRTEIELHRTRGELELRVQERTRELAQTNASLRQQIAERRRAEAARNELLRQLVNAQEDERRRISRELHDELGQQVSALTLKLAILRQDPSVPPAVREQIVALEKMARKTDSELDFLVWQLRPTVLDDLGLAAALREFALNWSDHFGIACTLHTPAGDDMRLDPEIETVLYRVAQEALNNIAKHARARNVELRLERGASHASLAIVDDGVGFEVGAGRRARGLGLVGMRERASFIGGQMTVASRPGEGTRIKVDVPLSTAT